MTAARYYRARMRRAVASIVVGIVGLGCSGRSHDRSRDRAPARDAAPPAWQQPSEHDLDKDIRKIGEAQAAGFDGGSAEILRAWPYHGPPEVHPLAGDRPVPAPLELALPAAALDPAHLHL